MALGYENTGIAPRLISHAGDAISADIRRIGQGVREDILDYQAGRQAGELLTQAKAIDATQPDFQQNVVGLLAKYPLALRNDGARAGLALLGQQWKAKQQENLLLTKFNQQKGLIDYRNEAGGTYGEEPVISPLTGSGGLRRNNKLLGTQPNFISPEEQEQAGNSAMETDFGLRNPLNGPQSPLGVPFQLPEMAPQSQDQEPDLMSGVRPAYETLKQYKVDKKTGQRVMGQVIGQAFLNQQKAAKPITRNIPGVGMAQYNPDTKEWDVAIESKSPQRWLNMGTHWENADTGEQRPIEISAAKAADIAAREGAATAKAAEGAVKREDRATTRAISIINDKIKEKENTLKTLGASITKSRIELDKAENPDPKRLTELATWQKQFQDIQKEVSDLQADRDEVGAAKELDKDTAAALLKEAGGDKEKARALARSRGYKL